MGPARSASLHKKTSIALENGHSEAESNTNRGSATPTVCLLIERYRTRASGDGSSPSSLSKFIVPSVWAGRTLEMWKYSVRIEHKAPARACERNWWGSSRGPPHLHNLVFRVDELDLWHIDAHGIARLFCLLSREIQISTHEGSISYSPSTLTAECRTDHLGTGRSPWSQRRSAYSEFSRDCLISLPPFLSRQGQHLSRFPCGPACLKANVHFLHSSTN